jgi:hypothetical protein
MKMKRNAGYPTLFELTAQSIEFPTVFFGFQCVYSPMIKTNRFEFY